MFELGVRLRQLREQRRWTQEDLGRKVDRSKSVICSYESGLKLPPLEILVQLAEIFHVSLDWLAGLDRGESLQTQGLSPEQKQILALLLEEFQSERKPADGLTPRQMTIINALLQVFCKRQVGAGV